MILYTKKVKWNAIKPILKKIFEGIAIYLVIMVISAVSTNLVLLNRMDERIQAIEIAYQKQDMNFVNDLWHYESWLRAITKKLDELQPRVIRVEAKIDHTQLCVEQLKRKIY